MFGREKERTRLWALLGVLLKDLRLLEALDFMGRAYGTKPVHWPILRDAVSRGESLADVADALVHGKTPPPVVAALRAGEKDGRLPERLAELLSSEEAGGWSDPDDASTVSLADQILAAVVEKGGSRIVVTAAGLAALGIEIPDSFIPPIVRRLWIMAGQPYWAPKPATLRVRRPGGEGVEFRLSLQAPGEVVLELSQRPASR